MTGDDVRRAVRDACGALEAAGGSDRSVVAGDLTWSCRETAEHVANALLPYAAQLVGEAVDGWLPFDIAVEATGHG